MLLAELGSTPEKNLFTGINFDGIVQTDTNFAVIGGTEVIETGMQNYLAKATADADGDLTTALRLSLETWAVGKELSTRESEETDLEETQMDTTQMYEVVDAARQDGEIEAGVLETSQHGSSKFRLLTSQEIEAALK